LGLGFSTIKWSYKTSTTQVIESYKGSGIYYTFGITDRFFIADFLGIFANVSYKGYSYNTINANYTSSFQQIANSANSQKFSWKLNGVNLSAGLSFKF